MPIPSLTLLQSGRHSRELRVKGACTTGGANSSRAQRSSHACHTCNRRAVDGGRSEQLATDQAKPTTFDAVTMKPLTALPPGVPDASGRTIAHKQPGRGGKGDILGAFPTRRVCGDC
jgi:hypothetical protein